MNRTVIILLSLLVVAVIGGIYRAQGFLGIVGANPSATLSRAVQPAEAPPLVPVEHEAYDQAVEAVSLHLSSAAPVVVSRPGSREHPVDVLARRMLRGGEVVAQNLLRLARVSVNGNYYVNDEDIIRIAGVSNAPWLWDKSLSDVQKSIKSSPWIRGSEVSWKLYPLSLAIEVQEAKPWLVAELSGQSWLISRSGELLQPLQTITDTQLILDSVKLPRLDGLVDSKGDENSATQLSARLSKALSILAFYRIADGFPFAVDRFTYLGSAGILVTPSERARFPEVMIDGYSFSDAKTALSNLQAVLQDLEKRSEKAVRVDLRFNGQVVVVPAGRLELPSAEATHRSRASAFVIAKAAKALAEQAAKSDKPAERYGRR